MSKFRRKTGVIDAVQVSDVLAAQAGPAGLVTVAPWLAAAYNDGKVFFGSGTVGVVVPGVGPQIVPATSWVLLDENSNLGVLDAGSFANTYEAV